MSREHKEKIENIIQCNTFIKEMAIPKSCCYVESCCFKICSSCCFKPGSGVCKKKVKPNMYQILGLDMKQELKENKEDIAQQERNIEQAFAKSMKKYNPTQNREHGNEIIVDKLQEARDKLKMLETRVEHVNDYEYQSSSCFLNYYGCCHCDCSCAFWRSLLYPLQVSKDDKSHISKDGQQYERKSKISRKFQCCQFFMLLVSVCLAGLGFSFSFLFGPDITTTLLRGYVVAGFGGGLAGAGTLGFFATLNKELEPRNYLIILFLGSIFGASTEVISHAIIEELHFSKMTPVLEEMIIGLITGFVGSILSWFSNIIQSCCFERETLNTASIVIYFCCGPVLGSCLGAIIGCASGALKVELTQDTGLDTFTFVSFVKRLFLRTQRRCVKCCTTNVKNLAQKKAKDEIKIKANKNQKHQIDLSSGSVQSINMSCFCCCYSSEKVKT